MRARSSTNWLALALILVLLSYASGPTTSADANDDIVVFAAASLKTALDDISREWTKESGTEAAISLAASSKLAKQIQQGAPADVFISANVKWMDVLQSDNLIEPGTRRDIVRNRIVLIAHGRTAKSVSMVKGLDIATLLNNGRLAMAMVNSVPAGIYGKAALTSLGIWDQAAPSVAQTDNVRAALLLVARGEAPYGIVYATDAAASDNVTVAGTFPLDTHPPIIYPVAVMAESKKKALAMSFLKFLTSAKAKLLFEKQGFATIEPVTANPTIAN